MDDANYDDLFASLFSKHRTDFKSTGIPKLDEAIAKVMDLNDAIQKIGKKHGQ